MKSGIRLAYIAFVALLVAALSMHAREPASASLPASAEEIVPLSTGDPAPAFTVRTVDNERFSFDPQSLDKPVVLISFRGGWCPYCNMHLSELRTVIPDIRALGYDILFISNDPPARLYSSLEGETQEDIDGLDYVILSDAELNAALAFGTAFRVADSYIARLDDHDLDYTDSSLANFKALAVPSVYVVDTTGTIVYDYVNADYKVRLAANELRAVAEQQR
jgi:peroxiredoxin